jgi:hypothetical protein
MGGGAGIGGGAVVGVDGGAKLDDDATVVYPRWRAYCFMASLIR